MREGKAMKDYTKYDFAAIVGAEVRIKYDNNADPYNGIVLGLFGEGQLSKPIILLKTSSIWYEAGDVITQLPCNILSLSAKIKVEDMTLKQLLRMMDEYKYRSPKLDENGIWFECSNGDKAVARFGKDIDCADWGWKHE